MMIGNNVRVLFTDEPTAWLDGELRKLDPTGATIWRPGTYGLPETQGNVFVPMHRIKEIIDQGRTYR